jgi:hypothetical protein
MEPNLLVMHDKVCVGLELASAGMAVTVHMRKKNSSATPTWIFPRHCPS